jgi:hypothetical protein
LVRLVSGGTAVALEPAHYQFGAKVHGWDANWVVIAGAVTTPEGSWSFREGSLTTYEAPGVSAWLRSVASKAVETVVPDDMGFLTPSLTFTEPDLAFSVAEYTNDSVDLRVHLSHGAAPPWLDIDERLNMWQPFVAVRLSQGELFEAATTWDREWSSFPERP